MVTVKTTAIYALTSSGANTARRVAGGLSRAEVFLPEDLAGPDSGERTFKKISEALARNFHQYDGHVVVAAAGIVVRSLVGLLEDKTKDPAVVVVDQEGRFAISLLSGHLGGANELARRTAAILGGQAVVTTATDSAGKPSLEVTATEQGLKVENIKALSRISRMILEGEKVPVYDPDNWLKPALAPWPESFIFLEERPGPKVGGPLVWVGHEDLDHPDSWLICRPPVLAVGLGCNRGTPVEEIEELLRETFKRHGLAVGSIGLLASIEAKSDEIGILALAERLKVKIEFFRPEELAAMETPNPSEAVEKHMGVKSVCEAAAMLAARTTRLLAAKQKSRNVTIAAALIAST